MPKIVEVLADVARNASYPQAEVELAKGNALQGLAARESTPEFQAQKALARAVYGDHPYHVVAPSAETIQAATPAQLKQEHARRFRPERSLLVVVGEFDAAAVSAAVTKHLRRVEGRQRERAGHAAVAVRAGHAAAADRAARRFGAVADRGRPRGRHRHRSRLLPAAGGEHDLRRTPSAAASSRTSARTRATPTRPDGSIATRAKGGLLTATADVRTEVTGATLTEIFYEQDRMGSTLPTDEELQRAKRYQGGLYLLRNQIQTAVARHARLELGERPAARGARRVRLEGERGHGRSGARRRPQLLPVVAADGRGRG